MKKWIRKNRQEIFVGVVWMVFFVLFVTLTGCDGNNDAYPKMRPSFTVKGTRDIEVTGVIHAKELTDVRKLDLKKGARIVLDDAPLYLDLEELHSDDGVIQSFSTETAMRGLSGPPGNEIRIRAKHARGFLRINASGKNGGEGNDGMNGRDGNQGARGVPGIYDVKPDNQLPVSKNAEERERLKAYYLAKKYGDPNASWDLWFFCSQQTGDGGQGLPGEYGQDGQKGGDGGNTSPVFLQVEEGERFVADVSADPGRGALGGRGGLGGKGGPEGPPGIRDNGHICRDAVPGAKGVDGLAGRPGSAGKAGNKNPVCVQIDNHVSGDCSK